MNQFGEYSSIVQTQLTAAIYGYNESSGGGGFNKRNKLKTHIKMSTYCKKGAKVSTQNALGTQKLGNDRTKKIMGAKPKRS